VVKYTGDGLLASFRGRGRAHHALRCAIALQELDAGAEYRDDLRIGIGLAEGVVMGGPIGEPGGRQYDVIGATVHLAARLCAVAEAGEIVTTPRLVRSAGMTEGMRPAARSTTLRGFPEPVEYVSYQQLVPRTVPDAT
jgi:adenylate cyclase